MPSLKTQEQSWVIREVLPNELNFIYSTWLNSFRYDSFLGKCCTNSIFFSEYSAVIDHVLSKPTTKISIAHFNETPDVILSYMVHEPSILHYMFTKEIYRNNKIAKSLFEAAFKIHEHNLVNYSAPILFTHRTFTAEPFIEKYKASLVYNPFKLYERLSSISKKQTILEKLV